MRFRSLPIDYKANGKEKSGKIRKDDVKMILKALYGMVASLYFYPLDSEESTTLQAGYEFRRCYSRYSFASHKKLLMTYFGKCNSALQLESK